MLGLPSDSSSGAGAERIKCMHATAKQEKEMEKEKKRSCSRARTWGQAWPGAGQLGRPSWSTAIATTSMPIRLEWRRERGNKKGYDN